MSLKRTCDRCHTNDPEKFKNKSRLSATITEGGYAEDGGAPKPLIDVQNFDLCDECSAVVQGFLKKEILMGTVVTPPAPTAIKRAATPAPVVAAGNQPAKPAVPATPPPPATAAGNGGSVKPVTPAVEEPAKAPEPAPATIPEPVAPAGDGTVNPPATGSAPAPRPGSGAIPGKRLNLPGPTK